MKILSQALLVLSSLGWTTAGAQIANFQHVVVIVQENRTPDNLFYGLCENYKCSSVANDTSYDIQTSNWLDKAVSGTVQPMPVPLASHYDLGHTHPNFVAMCDLNVATNTCAMDGAAGITCKGTHGGEPCPPNPQFKYVDNSTGLLNPYITLATQYGWSNLMFQTNQGPSFPAHQFLFGATSAPNKADDHNGTFASENLIAKLPINGCIASFVAKVQLIDASGTEDPKNKIYPCFEHQTVADLLGKKSITWRYYTPGPGDLWSAPDAIEHICEPNNNFCMGPLWKQNVDVVPSDVFSDITACNLRGVSWVIPSAINSDHAGITGDGGPSWVASIVNAIGTSPCLNKDGSSYWDSTAILITWDDWGGWYDHEAPTILRYPEGGYQYGFRVPFLFVSAYTPQGYINDEREDFGAIVRFIENNFGIKQGDLTFADARTTKNLIHFYNLAATPRTFTVIPTPKGADYFTHDKTPLGPPDDD